MFCPYCGSGIEDTYRFCPSCGKALPVIRFAEPQNTDAPEIGFAVVQSKILIPEQPPVFDGPSGEPMSEEAEADPEQGFATEAPKILIPEPPPVSRKAEEVPAPKKGRLWPPLLICAVMFAIGIAAFFLISTAPQDPAMPWYRVTDGVLYFDSSRYSGPEELVIPSQLAGETVTAIGEGAFAYCDAITTVTIPDTVTHIRDGAFFGCTNIRGVMIPESVIFVGSEAFRSCTALEAICIPYTVKTMGSNALSGCTGLKYIIYPGPHSAWKELYPEVLAPKVEIHTADGVFSQVP